MKSGESPLRLVRVGLVTLDDGGRVVALDEIARHLLACGDDALGQTLTNIAVPADLDDIVAAAASAPTRWQGIVPATQNRLLIQRSELPSSSSSSSLSSLSSLSSSSGGSFASVVSVNEYLAESQALARVQLRQTVESIIAGFAHEVRNPLAAILSLTEAALAQDPTPDSVLVRVPGLVQRVESLLQHSLAYSRPKPPQRSPHQLSWLVHRAAGLLRRRPAPAPRFILRGINTANVPAVIVDHLQAEQVLVNLFENALDAAKSEVIVRVLEGASPQHAVCLEVADDGAGVPDDLVGRIFDPFFTTKAHGTGLGLAIARDLTRLNGGDLRLVQRPRSGAVFRVIFSSTHAAIRAEW